MKNLSFNTNLLFSFRQTFKILKELKPEKPKDEELDYSDWIILSNPKYHYLVVSEINKLGSLTLKYGHCKELDSAKDMTWGLIGLNDKKEKKNCITK